MANGTAPNPRFRLAIVGGGISGLTLAACLGHYQDPASPIHVDMYESGSQITTTGAGISLWARTWVMIRDLGIYDALMARTVTSEQPVGSTDGLKPAFVLRKSDLPTEGLEFGRVMVPNGSTTMHRKDLMQTLLSALPDTCTIHTSKRLVKYTESTKNGSLVYTLHFTDGTTAEADVVVGTDGVKSETRASMYDYAHARECSSDTTREECERCKRATPMWTGIVAHRYLLPTDRLREVNPKHRALQVNSPMTYGGRGRHVISYPISNGECLNWIGFVTTPGGRGTPSPYAWVAEASKEDLFKHFQGWEPEVQEMIECVDKPMAWSIHIMNDLPFWTRGRVALVGDAVHAMETHFGAAGGQAMEDAYILGRLLAKSDTTLDRVHEVLKVYETVRMPFCQGVVKKATKAGLMYEFALPELWNGEPVVAATKEEELELTMARLAEMRESIQDIWKWQWEEKLEDQWAEAAKLYDSTVRA